ncbi:Putative PAN/Apple domain-containing protein [Septoria linicola]|uniref:PAN/Apple domain-containing protein n=1 Tax=Septoria linicola TaxID=215465 RepID=A0A9Q9EQ31_9PEZI|nr:putative PAN/Apple domain-containing protein [Septoria linicola]USW59401.1 Putative PAN/Apple domain-containing protein [Septoria linicola]
MSMRSEDISTVACYGARANLALDSCNKGIFLRDPKPLYYQSRLVHPSVSTPSAMKVQQFLSLVGLSSSTFVAAELCGNVGILTTLPYYTSTSPALYNAVACGEHCASDTECRTYALGLGMCLHYASSSSSTFEELSSSPWTLYDRDCTPDEAHRSQLIPLGARCLIDPNSTKSRFHLLGPDFVPLVMTAQKQLQPRRARIRGDEERIRAVGLPSRYEEAPKFFFQKAASAPAGLYDLVVAGPQMHYVAKAADGEVVLTLASTGTTAEDVNGRTIVTSIFTVDCDGRIGAMHEGIHYSLEVNANISFTAGSRLPDSTLVAVDFDALGVSRNQQEISRNRLELRSLSKKRSDSRCPAGQRAIAKPGAPPDEANGCGPPGAAKLVPELSFGKEVPKLKLHLEPLRTCRQIYQEAAPLLYTDNTFSFEAQIEMFQFVDVVLKERQRRLLRSLTIAEGRLRDTFPLHEMDQADADKLNSLTRFNIFIDGLEDNVTRLDPWNTPQIISSATSVSAVITEVSTPDICVHEQRTVAELLETTLRTSEADIDFLTDCWIHEIDEELEIQEDFDSWIRKHCGIKEALKTFDKGEGA